MSWRRLLPQVNGRDGSLIHLAILAAAFLALLLLMRCQARFGQTNEIGMDTPKPKKQAQLVRTCVAHCEIRGTGQFTTCRAEFPKELVGYVTCESACEQETGECSAVVRSVDDPVATGATGAALPDTH